MSVFKLPVSVCKNLTAAIARFWWESEAHRRKIHWTSMEKLCLPTYLGGLGFRDISSFNKALLAKQSWRLLSFPQSLMARLLKSRYFISKEFLASKLGSSPSYAWRSIIHGRELLIQGLKKNIGNGKQTFVWTEKWIESKGKLRAPLIKLPIINLDLKVRDLIHQDTGLWNQTRLQELFYRDDFMDIQQISPARNREDYWSWKHTQTGFYSVKTGYDVAAEEKEKELRCQERTQPSINELKQQVWNLNTVSKIKHFCWKALTGVIAVQDALKKRGIKSDGRCQFCGIEGESINHVLFSCHIPRQIWAIAGFPSPQEGFENGSLLSNFHHVLTMSKDKAWPIEQTRLFPWLLWYSWKNRNQLIFEGVAYNAEEIVMKARKEADEWFIAKDLKDKEVVSNLQRLRQGIQGWTKPPVGWLKCNIGASFDKRSGLGGASMVLRDHEGTVLLHSRRAFSNLSSRNQAYQCSTTWAIENMVVHCCQKVIIAQDNKMIFNALMDATLVPSLLAFSDLCKPLLDSFQDWFCSKESVISNKGAQLIADSVIKDRRLGSYVAQSFPLWLKDLFLNEASS